MKDTDNARILRLMRYSRIIDDAKRALEAIRDCPQADPARHVAAVDAIACEALTQLEIALDEALA